jgi:hypothetical protein
MNTFLLMKKHIIHQVFLLLLLGPAVALAQNYTRSIGVRGGQTSGFTYRQYLDESNAYEGIVSFKHSGLQLTFLKEFIKPYLTEHSDNIYLIWGFGAHAGTNRTSSWEIFTKKFYDLGSLTPSIGVDGFAGLEYRIREIPLIVGADFKPFFDLAGARFFSMSIWDFAISIKYNL